MADCSGGRSSAPRSVSYSVSATTARIPLEIRLIQTEDELLYSYQLFTDIPLVRWDNAPHFPALPTFPHHMHDETGTVSSSPLSGDPPQDLPYILDQLAALLPRL